MNRFRTLLRYGIMAILLLLLGTFLILPVTTVIREGCHWPLFTEVFRNFVYRSALWNALCIAMGTTLLVTLIALPLALLYDRFDFPGRRCCMVSMLLPMILPPFVGALGFQQLLGHYGILNTILVHFGAERVDFLGGPWKFWSICFVEALHLYPVFFLNLVTALGNIDPSFTEAAANMGASRWKRFCAIRLPLLRSGFLAGGSIVLIWSFTELGTPLMFGYNRVTPVQIFNGINELGTNPIPYTLVIILLTVSALLYALARLTLGSSAASISKGSTGSVPKPLGPFCRYLPGAAFAAVTLLAILPHLTLIGIAFSTRYYGTVLPQGATFSHFREALSNPLVLPSIGNSLRYSLLAMLLATAAGVAAALAQVRWKLRGSMLLDILVMLPLAIPGVVIAFGYCGMTVRYPWAKALFNPVENPLWLLGIAYAVRRIPYVVRSVVSGLEQTPEALELAARNFGATPAQVLRKITFPLISANLFVGGLFAFSFSMLEVSDSLILAQKSEYFPITKALLEISQILGPGVSIASAFGVWTMLFLAMTLISAGILLGKKIGEIFHL